MPLDENLNARIRALVADGLEVGGKAVRPRQVAEKKMFGGVCFLYRGNMFCGADAKNGLMVRVGPEGLFVPEEARPLTRMIARTFDAYDLSKAGHSPAV